MGLRLLDLYSALVNCIAATQGLSIDALLHCIDVLTHSFKFLQTADSFFIHS